jgi:cytochrome b561
MLRRAKFAGQQVLIADRRLTIGRLLEQFQTVLAYCFGAKEGCMTYGTLPPGGYPASSKLFHWLVAISVIIQAPLGIILVYAELGAWQDRLYNFHKSMGVLILILMVLRLLNRALVGAPAPEPTIADWQRTLSSAVHGALYLLLILQALVGYWANSAFGASTPFFGLFEIPAIGSKNDALSTTLFMWHRWIGIALVILVGMHVAAALQHYFIQRDGVLQRMLPQALGGR